MNRKNTPRCSAGNVVKKELEVIKIKAMSLGWHSSEDSHDTLTESQLGKFDYVKSLEALPWYGAVSTSPVNGDKAWLAGATTTTFVHYRRYGQV